MSEVEKNDILVSLEELHEKFIKFIHTHDDTMMNKVNLEVQKINKTFYSPDCLTIQETTGSCYDPDIPPDADTLYESMVADLFHPKIEKDMALSMDFFMKQTMIPNPTIIGNMMRRIHHVLSSEGPDVLVVSKDLRWICSKWSIICEESTKLQKELENDIKNAIDKSIEVAPRPSTPTPMTPRAMTQEEGNVEIPDAPLKKRKAEDEVDGDADLE